MIKKQIKYFLKNSNLVFNFVAGIIFLYLKFVNLTTRWHLVWHKNLSQEQFLQSQGVIFITWHNRLAFSPKMFCKCSNIAALVSTHSDGKIVTKIIKLWGKETVSGSTNKNPLGALKQIINRLKKGHNIVITPDGPRGPVYKINSAINKIAYNYNKKIIPVSCAANKYFKLNSWDKMIIPKPFSTVIVTIGEEFTASGNLEDDNLKLEETLMQLTHDAESRIKQS